MRKRKKRIVAGTMVAIMMAGSILCNISPLRASDVGRILRTFKIKKNVEVTDNGKIII